MSLGLARMSLGFRTRGGFSIAGLLGTDTAAGYWNTNNAASLFQDASKTTAAGDTDLCRVVASSGGGAGDLSTSGDANRLTVAVSGGVTGLSYIDTAGYVMSNDGLDFTSLADCLVMVAIKPDLSTDNYGAIAQVNSATRYFGIYRDGVTTTLIDTATLGATRYVNGTASTAANQDEFHDELTDDTWHVLEWRGADITGAADVFFPAASIRGVGQLGPCLIAPTSLVGDHIDAIRTEIGAAVGLSL